VRTLPTCWKYSGVFETVTASPYEDNLVKVVVFCSTLQTAMHAFRRARRFGFEHRWSRGRGAIALQQMEQFDGKFDEEGLAFGVRRER
jgi:hypothetical protein